MPSPISHLSCGDKKERSQRVDISVPVQVYELVHMDWLSSTGALEASGSARRVDRRRPSRWYHVRERPGTGEKGILAPVKGILLTSILPFLVHIFTSLYGIYIQKGYVEGNEVVVGIKYSCCV